MTAVLWLAAAALWAQTAKPQAQLAVTDISCAGQTDGKIEVALINGTVPVSFQWINLNTGALGLGQLTAVNQPVLLSGLQAGLYRFGFTDANGADTSLQRFLLEPPPLKGQIIFLSQYGAYQLPCAQGNTGEVLLEWNGGTLPFQFLWSNGDTGVRADSLPPGPVGVSITDARGCSLQLNALLEAPPPIVTSVDAEGEVCLGENSGSIALTGVSGGQPPYQYLLNSQPTGNTPNWQNLPPGQYLVQVRDAAGCLHTDGVVLPSGIEFVLKLGPDTTILSGDTLRLSVYADPPAQTLVWEPNSGVQVLSNEEVLLFPAFSTSYAVTAFSSDGCRASDAIHIEVNRHRDWYVPNVFAPQALDPVNQRFTVFCGPGIRLIEQFRVYDRFGRLWFDGKNLPANTSGWDGTDGADQAPPGVYLWRIGLRFSDGRTELLQGDVTLLR